MSGRFSGSGAARTVSQLHIISCCVRTQRNKRIHRMGSKQESAAQRAKVRFDNVNQVLVLSVS
jgi:hypothetical protein